jgi:hypothetical protein
MDTFSRVRRPGRPTAPVASTVVETMTTESRFRPSDLKKGFSEYLRAHRELFLKMVPGKKHVHLLVAEKLTPISSGSREVDGS